MKNADLNEMTYTKLILLIDVRSSKQSESRDYTDETSALA
jgi:hypothetical protein